MSVATYWIEQFDIDGWRLDVANEVTHDFWREFCGAMRKIKPDVFILGELWHNSMKWIGADQLDSTMNYPLTTACDELFSNKGKPSKFANTITNILHWYPETTNNVLFNMVSSHDIARLLSRCKEDTALAQLAFTFLLTYPGSPCIYYGDEVGMLGGSDPDCRRCMEWDPKKQNLSLFAYLKNLISLRKKYKALSSGDFNFLEISDSKNYFVFQRKYLEERVVVIINLNQKELHLKLNIISPNAAEDIVTNEMVDLKKSMKVGPVYCKIIAV